MSEQSSTSRTTDLAISLARGRVSRVTLALVLNTHLAGSPSAGRMSALARLTRATDGLSSVALDYVHRVSISASLINPISTFHLWLTQYATVHGYLLASGVNPREWSSSRKKVEEIRRMSEAGQLIDVDAFTTKVERSRQITNWALGDGRFNCDTSLETLAAAIWQAETDIRSGLAPTYNSGFRTEASMPRGAPQKPQRRPKLPGWIQMTFDV